LAFRTHGEEMGASGEGVNCGAFVGEGLITIPRDVLISVGQLPVEIKLHEAVGLVEDGEVEHANFAIAFFFTCPLDAGVVVVRATAIAGDPNRSPPGRTVPHPPGPLS
jgi:hypothetical protein